MRKNESINNRNYIDEDTFFEASSLFCEDFKGKVDHVFVCKMEDISDFSNLC